MNSLEHLSKEYIWKIMHLPTGLFYCSKKGRFRNKITNLSEKGNHYTSEKQVEKVLEQDVPRCAINEAQTKRYDLPLKIGVLYYNSAKLEDFKIIKFELTPIL